MLILEMCSDYGIVPIIKILKTIFMMIQIVGPILAIVSLGVLFFRLMVFDYDERTNVNATKKYIGVKKQVRNALLALVITFFLPYIVSLVMNMTFMVDNFTVAECWSEADKIKFDPNGEYIKKTPAPGRQRSGSYIINPNDYVGQGTNDNPNATNDPNGNNGSDGGNTNDKGGTAGLSNSGKVSYLTKNGKNWNLNEKIGYSLDQSACSDGTYLYTVFKRDDSHAKVAKFDIASRKLVKKSGVMNLGHANDMTYDFSRNKIIITRRETNDLSLSVIDPNTFAKSTVKVKIPGSVPGSSSGNLRAIKAFNGIAYDKNRGQLLVRARYGNSQLVWVDSNYKAVRGVTIRKAFGIPTQGMEIVGNKVIYSQSILQYRSSVTSYKRTTGSKIKSTSLGVHGELEGVFYYNGDLYGITYDKRGKNKSLVYKIHKGNY